MPLDITEVRLDADEYSRYADDGRHKIGVDLLLDGAEEGDQVDVELVRQDGFGTLETKTLTLQLDQTEASTVFDLRQVKDPDTGINHVVTDDYVIRATKTTDPLVTKDSAQFPVGLVTVKEIRDTWCYGLPLYAFEVRAPKIAPRSVTGVELLRFSEATAAGGYDLAWTKSTNTLAWDGGQGVVVDTSKRQRYILLTQSGQDYAEVQVTPHLLPAADANETIFVDRLDMSDDVIRRYIRNATNWLEERLQLPVEPRLCGTRQVAKEQFVERVYDAVAYERPESFYSWIWVQLPVGRVQHVYRLDGFFNTQKVVAVPPDQWVVFDDWSGLIQLVPNVGGSVVNWQFFQSTFMQFLFTYRHVPDFWHYRVVAGLLDVGSQSGAGLARELIAKRAAIDTLIQAGSAWRGGFSSESISRDGVSESVSYTQSAMYGLYAHVIEPYKDQLEEEMPRFKQRQAGTRARLM